MQAALINRLGTDPSVKDLARVMRLPGTSHLKKPGDPWMVTLDKPSRPAVRWSVAKLAAALNLSLNFIPKAKTEASAGVFGPANSERLRRLFGAENFADGALSAGLTTNINEIEAAVSMIPASEISTEAEWVRFARGLAHTARIYKSQAEDFYRLLDAASAAAPGYDRVDNEARWLRYVAEALDRDDPITIATVFALATKHGWRGNPSSAAISTGSTAAPDNASPATFQRNAGGTASFGNASPVSSSGNPATAVGTSQSPNNGIRVSFGKIPHRQWLYGIDLVRGELTLIAAPGGLENHRSQSAWQRQLLPGVPYSTKGSVA